MRDERDVLFNPHDIIASALSSIKTMNFNLKKSIELLERIPEAYKVLFYGLDSNWATINEGENTWSAFDIVGHLIHGELTDWIPRAKIILSENEKNKTFEPFDRFAQEKSSKGKTIEELIDEFEKFRKLNLEELNSWNLTEEDLDKTGIHPELGEVTLKQLISTWTIHDIAHLNQISRVIVKDYAEDVGPWAEYLRILRK